MTAFANILQKKACCLKDNVYFCSIILNGYYMIDYFNRHRARKQEEPQSVEQDENGRAKYTPEFIKE
jgi:hypothetical protein